MTNMDAARTSRPRTNLTSTDAAAPAPSETTATLATIDATQPTAPAARTLASPETQAHGRARFQRLALAQRPAPPKRTAPVDVGSVTREQLTAMRASSNPVVREQAATVARAQKSYAQQIAAGAKVTVSTSAGNGGKPVVTIVPPGFDPSLPARVHTHYHGFNATAADAAGHGSGTTARIDEIQRHDPQAVFVLPECNNAQSGSYATDWSNVRSQALTTSDALKDAGVTNVGTRIVSAHSGGGAALARAMQAKPDGSGVQADRVELQDSLYGSESAVAKWASTAAGQAAKRVVYLRGTNPRGRDAEIARAFGDRYQRVNVSAPKDVPFIAGTHLRKYNADAHNRTVGEFMDSVPGP